MDVQPSLSPFSPALSYSLLVDDIFNLEDQGITLIFTDDETADEDLNNNNIFMTDDKSTDDLQQQQQHQQHVELVGPDVMDDHCIEEMIIFDPRISEAGDMTALELMEVYNAEECHAPNEDVKPTLLRSLCSDVPTPVKHTHKHSSPNQSTLSSSPLVGSSPGPLSPMLPPCRVCGEKASGFHYGANTCEACKGFFRRSLQRKQSYKCIGSNDCDISSGKRNVCAACRYRKCLSLGMSKTAIKTGRYTHAKKTKDIQEVKRLQRKQQLQMSLKDNQIESSHFMFSAVDDAIDQEAADRILDRIMNVHRQQTPHTPEFFEKLPHKEQDYLVKRRLKEEMFGPLRPISRDEYSNIYHCTGIDVDGRKAMLEHMLPCIEGAVKRFVTFAKAVPGFKELPLEDQIKLIKGSRFEAWLMSSYRAFNSEHLLYTHYCGSTVHLENMSRLYDEDFLRDVFKMVGDIKKLDLTEEEECMVKAILIFFRDRSLLQDPDLVDVHQMRLVQALNLLHQKRKPKDRIFFGRLSAILTEMRTLTDIHKTQENKIQVEWATDVPMPPLLYELFYV